MSVFDGAVGSTLASLHYNSGTPIDARDIGSPVNYWVLNQHTTITDLGTGGVDLVPVGIVAGDIVVDAP